MKTILITGGTGYIGINLTNHLVQASHNVHIIVRPTSDLSKLTKLTKNFKHHIFDGNTASLIEIMKTINPDIIIHLATLYIGEHIPDDIKSLFESNILFGAQLLEAAAICSVKYFINVGTHWQNYNGDDYNPTNLYAASKEAFEMVARYYIESTKMSMLTIKLLDTFGPFDTRNKIISLFKRIAKTGERLEMSAGEQEIGLLYIDDVLHGFDCAIETVILYKPHEHFTYILAPHEYTKLKNIATVFEEASGLKLSIDWGKRPYRNREIMKICVKYENILKNYKPLSLRDGIIKMISAEKVEG